MSGTKGIRALEDLAATQWGLFTAAQAADLGVRGGQCQRLVDAGRVDRLRRGVYAFGCAGASERADVRAAWLTAWPRRTAGERLAKRPFDAVVAGRTAAALLGFGDFYASPYTIAVRDRRQTAQDDLRFPLWRIDDRDVAIVDGLPVATPERIVADLVRDHEDPAHVGDFMGDAAEGGVTFDEGRLSELLAPLAARNGYRRNDGRAFARRLLAEHVEGRLARASADAMAAILGAYLGQSSRREARVVSPAADVPCPQFPPAAAAVALGHMDLPPAEVIEGLNSAIRSLNSLYELKQLSGEPKGRSGADTTGADGSADIGPAD